MAGSKRVQIRRLCLALPDTAETLTWGQPHFRVLGKIFAGLGDQGGKETLGFKLEREHADAVVQDPRFARAPYVGAHSWVSMDAAGIRDWDEVRAFLVESYRLIAPRRCWQAYLAGPGGASGSPEKAPRSGAPPRTGRKTKRRPAVGQRPTAKKRAAPSRRARSARPKRS